MIQNYIDLYEDKRNAMAITLAKKFISIYRLKPPATFRFILIRDERARYKKACRKLLDNMCHLIDLEVPLRDAQGRPLAATLKDEIKAHAEQKPILCFEHWCSLWYVFRGRNKTDEAIANKIVTFLGL